MVIFFVDIYEKKEEMKVVSNHLGLIENMIFTMLDLIY